MLQKQLRVERIEKMEEYFDALLDAVTKGMKAVEEKADILRELTGYYDGGLWLSDYEADERGELPGDLKRGVLSEDGVYNLLCDIDKLRKRTAG